MRGKTQTPGEIVTIARPLAEAVAPDMVLAAIKRHEARRKPAGLFRSAWNHVEYGMNNEYGDDISDYYLDSASALLGDIMQRSDVHQDVHLGALVLSSYMPLFAKRAHDRTVDPSDCDEVYHSLGAALQYLRPLHINEPPQWRMAEAAVLSLSARMHRPELLLFPASPREEQSANQQLNHDSYFYTGNDKLPIQQKLLPTQKIYDECITVLTLDPIINKALKVTGEGEGLSLADKVNRLVSLIIVETSGSSLQPDEKKFLDFLTTAVAAHHAELTGRGRQLLAA